MSLLKKICQIRGLLKDFVKEKIWSLNNNIRQNNKKVSEREILFRSKDIGFPLDNLSREDYFS